MPLLQVEAHHHCHDWRCEIASTSRFRPLDLSTFYAGFDQFDRLIVMTVVPLGIVGLCLGFQWLLSQRPSSLWQRVLVPSWFRSPDHPRRAEEWGMRLFHTALVCEPWHIMWCVRVTGTVGL